MACRPPRVGLHAHNSGAHPRGLHPELGKFRPKTRESAQQRVPHGRDHIHVRGAMRPSRPYHKSNHKGCPNGR